MLDGMKRKDSFFPLWSDRKVTLFRPRVADASASATSGISQHSRIYKKIFCILCIFTS